MPLVDHSGGSVYPTRPLTEDYDESPSTWIVSSGFGSWFFDQSPSVKNTGLSQWTGEDSNLHTFHQVPARLGKNANPLAA